MTIFYYLFFYLFYNASANGRTEIRSIFIFNTSMDFGTRFGELFSIVPVRRPPVTAAMCTDARTSQAAARLVNGHHFA